VFLFDYSEGIKDEPNFLINIHEICAVKLDNYIKCAYYIFMITLAKTTQKTTANPSAVFALWADINHWADHDQGIEWAKLEEDFAEGSKCTIKPKGGPKVSATILTIVPNEKFVDVSHLFGAKLQFDHIITQNDHFTTVAVTMTLSGPLTWLWAKILGKNQQADLEQATHNLITKAEKTS
jgi:hypothetical protein